MLKSTRAAIEFAEVWDAFMVRKTIATAWDIGFVPGAGRLGVWFPPLQGIVGALLYVELTTLLDRACRSQMTKAQSKKCNNLKNRIAFLDGQGKVLDQDKLQGMRGRRNDIAHDMEQNVERAELNEAVVTVRTQAVAWRLIGEPWPDYQPFAQQSRITTVDPSKYAMSFEHVVGVQKDARPVYEVTWQTHTPYLTASGPPHSPEGSGEGS